MKSRPTLLIGALSHVILTAWPAQASNFAVSTPGSATWEVFETDLGSKTVFRIESDTVLNWDDFQLGSGSELVFDFVGGSVVTNQLAGGGVKSIDGNVISNGVVGFFAPEGDIIVNGSITAKGVVVSTLEGDATVMTQGGVLQQAADSPGGQVRVTGDIRATGGDVLLAGREVVMRSTAVIEATGSVLVAGSAMVGVSLTGDQMLASEGESGSIRHLGQVMASRVEMVAGSSLRNGGQIDAGAGKVFLTVGESGQIKERATAVIVGDSAMDGLIVSGKEVDMVAVEIEGDSTAAVSDASLRMPALRRPDGSTVSGSRTVTSTSTMSASSDAAKARAVERDVARTVSTGNERASLIQRGSLFGLRGGVTRGGGQSSNTTSSR
jgi:hypothetical protein